jgi:hypothetical protein
MKQQGMENGLADKAAAAVEALEAKTKEIEGQEEVEHTDPETGEVIDIDALPKVRWNGKEYTPEELNRMVLMQSDYTRKTQKLAEEKKFMDNLQYDLDNVRNTPELAEQFKKVYPEKYHAFLNIVLNNAAKTGPEVDESEDFSGTAAETLKKQINALQKKLDSYDQKFHEEKVEATNAQLDAIFTELGQKYDLADEDAIVNRAQRLLEENRDNPEFQMTKGAWERLFRADHEARDKRFSERQKRLIETQAKQGSRAVDGGPGGVAPGRAQKRMTLDEATEAMIQDLS